MSALISASAVPARCDMTLAPHELPIHALRTNEALPIRHGISDFFETTGSGPSGPLQLFTAEAGPCAECPVPTMALSEAARPLSTHSGRSINPRPNRQV